MKIEVITLSQAWEHCIKTEREERKGEKQKRRKRKRIRTTNKRTGVGTYTTFSPANVKVCGLVAATFAAGFPFPICIEFVAGVVLVVGANVEVGVVEVGRLDGFMLVLLLVEFVVSGRGFAGSVLFFISSHISATFFSVSIGGAVCDICFAGFVDLDNI